MGWINDDNPAHEGYLIGLVKDEQRGTAAELFLRRLGSPQDDEPRRHVEVLQVACDCGWRSARFQAPMGTEWFPFIVELPNHTREAVETMAIALWRRHLEDPDPYEGWRANARAGIR